MNGSWASSALAFLVVVLFILLWAAIPDSVDSQLTPTWDYDPVRIEMLTTPELTDALCPPYSQLSFTEDGSYICSPG